MAEVYKRLIKNCIICWNYLYLSQKLAEIDDPAKWEELLQAMALGSAAAWGHLNLLGEYDFSEDKLQDSGRNQAPKTDRLNQVPSWEFRNRRKSFTPRQLARILWDFAYLCWANTPPEDRTPRRGPANYRSQGCRPGRAGRWNGSD
jgi:Tn3 transposase DDE domain